MLFHTRIVTLLLGALLALGAVGRALEELREELPDG